MTAERKLLLKALLKVIIKKVINFFQNYYKSMRAPTTHLQQSIIPTPSQPISVCRAIAEVKSVYIEEYKILNINWIT